MTKYCTNSTCEYLYKQPLTNFYKDLRKKDGLCSWCKECHKKYKQNNRKERNEQSNI